MTAEIRFISNAVIILAKIMLILTALAVVVIFWTHNWSVISCLFTKIIEDKTIEQRIRISKDNSQYFLRACLVGSEKK